MRLTHGPGRRCCQGRCQLPAIHKVHSHSRGALSQYLANLTTTSSRETSLYPRKPPAIPDDMKPITVIASFLGLAITATAAPATLERRWCYPVCCCTTSCLSGFCDESSLPGYASYCCHADLETVRFIHGRSVRYVTLTFSQAPLTDVIEMYLDGKCFLQTDLTGPILIPIKD